MTQDAFRGDVICERGITLPESALSWHFSRGTGPGGQSVNTTDSRVELVVDLTKLSGRSGDVERVLTALGVRLRIVVTSERSQLRNREIALARLTTRINDESRPVTPRRPTRPSRSSVTKGITDKRERSEIKEKRRPPRVDD